MAWNGTYAQDGAKSILNNTGTSELDSAIKGLNTVMQSQLANQLMQERAGESLKSGLQSLVDDFGKPMQELDIAETQRAEEKNSLDLMVQEQQEKERQARENLKNVLDHAKNNAQEQMSNEMVNNVTGGQDLPTLTQDINEYIHNYSIAQKDNIHKNIIDPVTNKAQPVDLSSKESSLSGIDKDIIKDFILHRDRALAAYKSGALTLGQYANIEAMAMKEGVSNAIKIEAEGKAVQDMIKQGFRTPAMYRREAEILKDSNPFYFKDKSVNEISLALSQGQDISTGRFDGQKYISQEKSDLERALSIYSSGNIGNTVNANINDKNATDKENNGDNGSNKGNNGDGNNKVTNNKTTTVTAKWQEYNSKIPTANNEKPKEVTNIFDDYEQQNKIDINGNPKTHEYKKEYHNALAKQGQWGNTLGNLSFNRNGKSNKDIIPTVQKFNPIYAGYGYSSTVPSEVGSEDSNALSKSIKNNSTITSVQELMNEISNFKSSEMNVGGDFNINPKVIKAISKFDSDKLNEASSLLYSYKESLTNDLATLDSNSREYKSIQASIGNIDEIGQAITSIQGMKQEQVILDQYDLGKINSNTAIRLMTIDKERFEQELAANRAMATNKNLTDEQREPFVKNVAAYEAFKKNGIHIFENALATNDPMHNFDYDKKLQNESVKALQSMFLHLSSSKGITMPDGTIISPDGIKSETILLDMIKSSLYRYYDDQSAKLIYEQLTSKDNKAFKNIVREYDGKLSSKDGVTSNRTLKYNNRDFVDDIEGYIQKIISKINDGKTDAMGVVKTRRGEAINAKVNDPTFRDDLEDTLTYFTKVDEKGTVRYIEQTGKSYQDFLVDLMKHKQNMREMDPNQINEWLNKNVAGQDFFPVK